MEYVLEGFHFSFAEYNNPANTNFGVLRVMNDDLVQPLRGTIGPVVSYECVGTIALY